LCGQEAKTAPTIDTQDELRNDRTEGAMAVEDDARPVVGKRGYGRIASIAAGFRHRRYLFSAQVMPSPTAKRARSTRWSASSLALSARIASVSASLSARLATEPPRSTLSISTIPPARTSVRQRS